MPLHRAVPFLLVMMLIAVPCLGETPNNSPEEDSYFDGVVYSATRFPQPRSRIADNITVVTAREIEEMHAHTVAEVLNQVNGVFVNFTSDFGTTSLINIQGSSERHVLVLLDGMEWNFLADGHAETNSIPIEIIDRIEIIKGPASSAWGSALGGVINIITKEAGYSTKPAGELKGAFGERGTHDLSAQFSGGTDNFGYYAHVGDQYSGGLVDTRGFERQSGFTKLQYTFSPGVNFGVSFGYSHPDIDFGDFTSSGFSSGADERVSFFRASLDARIVKDLNFAFSFYNTRSDLLIGSNLLATGELMQDSRFDQELTGGSAKLIWKRLNKVAVLGVDMSRGTLDQTDVAGDYYQSFGSPALTTASPDTYKWAVYSNGTFTFDRFSITPGVRFDHNDITGSFISPSIGMTYRFGGSILRASVSRGFTIPSLSLTSIGGLFVDPNPHLEPEEVWSYQAGIETTAIKYLRISTTLFYHDLKNAQSRTEQGEGAPIDNDIFINSGNVQRRGIEVGIETLPFYNFSVSGNFTFTDIEPGTDSDTSDIYTGNIGVEYNNGDTFKARITGHYVWWDLPDDGQSDFDDFIWDISLDKTVPITGKVKTKLFCKWHNIFNGAQQVAAAFTSPRRWMEAGFIFNF